VKSVVNKTLKTLLCNIKTYICELFKNLSAKYPNEYFSRKNKIKACYLKT